MSRFHEPSIYDRSHGPAPGAGADGLEGAYSATLVAAPSNGTVKVLIPALDAEHFYLATCSPAFGGAPGDSVLVVLDEGKHGWVVSPRSITLTDSRLFSPGDLKLSAVPSAPTGWLLCDGSPVLRTGATAALFSAIGTTYGAGDGSTTFNLPDLRGRVPLGAGTGTAAGATAHALGQEPTSGVGGEETHLLTGPESGIQAHNHPWSDSGFGLGVDNEITGGGATGHYIRGSGVQGAGTTGPTNATSAHNIMQPSATVNYFIKT